MFISLYLVLSIGCVTLLLVEGSAACGFGPPVCLLLSCLAFVLLYLMCFSLMCT